MADRTPWKPVLLTVQTVGAVLWLADPVALTWWQAVALGLLVALTLGATLELDTPRRDPAPDAPRKRAHWRDEAPLDPTGPLVPPGVTGLSRMARQRRPREDDQ